MQNNDSWSPLADRVQLKAMDGEKYPRVRILFAHLEREGLQNIGVDWSWFDFGPGQIRQLMESGRTISDMDTTHWMCEGRRRRTRVSVWLTSDMTDGFWLFRLSAEMVGGPSVYIEVPFPASYIQEDMRARELCTKFAESMETIKQNEQATALTVATLEFCRIYGGQESPEVPIAFSSFRALGEVMELVSEIQDPEERQARIELIAEALKACKEDAEFVLQAQQDPNRPSFREQVRARRATDEQRSQEVAAELARERGQISSEPPPEASEIGSVTPEDQANTNAFLASEMPVPTSELTTVGPSASDQIH